MTQAIQLALQARAQLTAPGAPFEVIDCPVGGGVERRYRNAFPTLPALLAASRVHGDQPYIRYQDQTWTFNRFFAEADAVAARLHAAGVGRGDRLGEKYFEIWEQMPVENHFIGITSANFPETDNMIGGGMHSDYVRLLFLTGFIGVGMYVLFILGMGTMYPILNIPEKFLLSSTVLAVLLWSVSTIPTLYAPLLYFVFPVFAYAQLPKSKR